MLWFLASSLPKIKHIYAHALKVLELYVAKYVDDLTLIETVKRNVPTTVNNTGDKTVHVFNPPISQSALTTIASRAEEKMMKLNQDKTQILTLRSGK